MSAMTREQFIAACGYHDVVPDLAQAAYAAGLVRDDWRDRAVPRLELQAAVDATRTRFTPWPELWDAISDTYPTPATDGDSA